MRSLTDLVEFFELCYSSIKLIKFERHKYAIDKRRIISQPLCTRDAKIRTELLVCYRCEKSARRMAILSVVVVVVP